MTTAGLPVPGVPCGIGLFSGVAVIETASGGMAAAAGAALPEDGAEPPPPPPPQAAARSVTARKPPRAPRRVQDLTVLVDDDLRMGTSLSRDVLRTWWERGQGSRMSGRGQRGGPGELDPGRGHGALGQS